jgi:integrase
VHEERGGNWRNGKHVAQWIATLETYAFPIIGEMLVDEIKASHVLDILNPIWRTKSETARRLKQRILVVLNWAQVREYRSSGIPAKAISDALGKSAERGANHFTALPYAQIPAVVAAIKGKLSMGSLGLYALILTAARSNEIRNAVRGEICFESQTWTIPAGRMKAGKEHTVHLTDATMEVFRTAMSLSHHNELIFPGARTKPMSDATILKALRQCGVPVDNATVHGFRSSFYDWASENMPHIPDAVVDAALAHQVSDKVKKAYKRTNFSEMRKELLGAWSDFCSAGHKANGEVRT